MKAKVETLKAPSPGTGPFSQAVIDDNLIFTSGQIYLTPENKLLEGTFEEQVHQIMKNLQAILQAAEASFADIVKTTIYVTDMAIYGKINEIYGSYFSTPYPAREVVCVKELPLGAQVEISMIAIKKKEG
ncbi:Rid family detoxifying hydrolase [Patescibacteria group bacterium]|nr:Rid family detoxifying hydrolase [Patescibacteria group bacterium]